jgi:hypothetical protein
MSDLAYIHPLLVSNPLPPDRLRSSRDRAAAACALAARCYHDILEARLAALPFMAAHDAGMRGHAHAWQERLHPALMACLDGVGAFARRQNDALAALLLAAADADVDPAARDKLQGAVKSLCSGAGAEQAIARQAGVAADNLRCASARDFVAFVVDADALRRALPPAQETRAAFALAIDARQRSMGDAMALVAGVIDALGALETAWGALVANFDTLAAQLAGPGLSSAVLLARLRSARAAWSALGDIAHLPPALRERARETAAPSVP